jgi:hypothetical protein
VVTIGDTPFVVAKNESIVDIAAHCVVLAHEPAIPFGVPGAVCKSLWNEQENDRGTDKHEKAPPGDREERFGWCFGPSGLSGR